MLLGALIAAYLTYRPSPEKLPSLFALDGDQASQLLEQKGYDVHVQTEGSCDPGGLVVDSEPPSGGLVDRGGSVTVRTSAVSGPDCEATFPWRVLSWQFLRYVLDLGDAPTFAPGLEVYVDGRLTPDSRGRLAAAVERAVAATSDTRSGLPEMDARRLLPPKKTCDAHRPPGTAKRSAIRIQLRDRNSDPRDCRLAVDLYRDDEGRIDLVAAYGTDG